MAIQRDERQVLTQPSGRLIREFRTQLPSPDMSGVQTFAKGLADVGEQEMRRTATEETKLYAESLDFGKDENGNFVKPQAPESFGSFRRELFNELVDRRYTTEVLLDHDTSVAKIYADNKAAGGDPGTALAKAEADMKGRLEGVDPRVRGSVELGMRKNITQYNTQAVAQSAANAERTLITDTVQQIDALSTRMVRAGAAGNAADEELLRRELEEKYQLLVRSGRAKDTPEARELLFGPIQTNINVRRALNNSLNDPKLDPDKFLEETTRLQRLIQGVAADGETAFGFKKADFDRLPAKDQQELYRELTNINTKFSQQYSVSTQMRQVQAFLNNVNRGVRNETFGMSEDTKVIAAKTFIDQINQKLASEGGQPIDINSPEALKEIHKSFGFIPSKLYDSRFTNISTRPIEEIEFASKLYKAARALPDANGVERVNVTGQFINQDDAIFLSRYVTNRNSQDPFNAAKTAREDIERAENEIRANKHQAVVRVLYNRATGKENATDEDFRKHISKKSGIEWNSLPSNARAEFMANVESVIAREGDFNLGIEIAAQTFKKNWVIDPTNITGKMSMTEKAPYVPRQFAFPLPLDGRNEAVPNWMNGYVGSLLSKAAPVGMKNGKPVEGTISITGISEPIPISSLEVGKNIFFKSTERGGYDSSVPWHQQDGVNPGFFVIYRDNKVQGGVVPIQLKNANMPLEIYPHAEAKAQHDKFAEAARNNSIRANKVDSWLNESTVFTRGFIEGASDMSSESKAVDAWMRKQIPSQLKPTTYDSMGKPYSPSLTDPNFPMTGERASGIVDLFREPNVDGMLSPETLKFLNRQIPERQSSLGVTGVIALGTNDGTPDAAYKGAIQAIETAKAQGINPVIVLPNAAEGNRFKPISDAVRRAAEEKGVQFEVLAYAANDPLHLDPVSAKTLADKYQGAVFFGDSNAVRIANAAGMKAQNRAIVDAGGVTVAREGAASAEISKLISGYRPGGRQQTAGLAGDAKSILDFVARPESGGNYNAFLGNAKNQTVDLTNMTLNEVMDFQRQMVRQGKESGAVGRYQIIGSTLQGLIKEMKLDPATTKFTAETQDKMAMQLLERRGYAQWKAGNLSDEEFANRIAQEWAGVPVVTGRKAGSSFYAGVGSNKAGVSSSAFLSAIKSARGAG